MAEPAAPLRRMTLDEWAALDEDEPGELVDGLLEQEEVPSSAHEIVVSWLIGVLRAWLIPRGGRVLGSETKLAISAKRGRKPDVVAFLPSTPLPKRRSSITRVAPDIVIEVVTATPRDGRRDRVEKKPDYASAGVRQYWLIDPELRTVEILARGDDGRFIEILAESSGTHAVAGLDGLTLDLDSLWTEIDSWPDDESTS
jgi:Uma2 family endonuclease